MYTLHIANKNYSSWSLRPWVLLKTLGIPFAEVLHDLPRAGTGDAAFRTFSPSGLVPVLVDGDWAAWESLGIVEYLADRHQGVWPTAQRARDWARSAAAEMHGGFSQLRNICGMNVGVRVRLGEVSAGLRRDLERLDELWTDGLTRFGGPFLAGEAFSAVDAFFCPVAFRIQSYDPPLSDAARAYAQRLLALPAMRDWEAAALAETFREPGHEAEAHAAGEIIEDRRATA